MEAGGLLIHQQAHLHPVGPLGHRGGKQIDRVGGGKNVEGIILHRLGGGGLSAGGEQQAKSAQGRKQFFHVVPLTVDLFERNILLYRFFSPV